MEDQVNFARRLRREMTPAERRFWALLHPWRERGWHWRRQVPVGPYVLDFALKRDKLAVEIDGDSHYVDAGLAHDTRRTAFLQGEGYRVLRFTNHDVLDNADGVGTVMLGILGEPDR